MLNALADGQNPDRPESRPELGPISKSMRIADTWRKIVVFVSHITKDIIHFIHQLYKYLFIYSSN